MSNYVDLFLDEVGDESEIKLKNLSVSRNPIYYAAILAFLVILIKAALK